MQGIYKITNKINGNYYVGSSIDISRRFQEHSVCLLGNNSSAHLQNAWNKYGEENFVFEFVEGVVNQNDLLEIEQRYLDEGFEKELLYNISRRAGGGNLGEEVNQKIGRANTGKKRTEEWKQALSERMTGENHPLYGKKGADHPAYGYEHTKEACQKISEGKKGEKNPNYSKATWNKGTTGLYSEEYCQKISEGASRPYPAFFNEKTSDFIPAGKNLWELCERRELNYCNMWNVKTIPNRVTRNGWRLASDK